MNNKNGNWIQRFQDSNIPILKYSQNFINKHKNSPGITISRIKKVIEYDPGFCLRMLIEAGKSKKTKITCLSHAMLMMGMPKVLSFPVGLSIIEETRSAQTRSYIKQTYHRHYFQACLCHRWAKQHSEIELEEIFTAAIVRNAVEWLIALVDPELTLACQKKALKKQITIQQAIEQIAHLNFNMLSAELAFHWNLPERVGLSFKKEKNQQSLWIEQAAKLAALADIDWHEQKLQTTLHETAHTLHQQEHELIADLHQCCVESSRLSYAIQSPDVSLAAKLVRLPEPQHEQHANQSLNQQNTLKTSSKKEAITVVKTCLAQMQHNQTLGYENLISQCFVALSKGVGLNRIIFTLLTPDKKHLSARYLLLPDNIKTTIKNQPIALDKPHLFQRILVKPATVWSRAGTKNCYQKLLPHYFYQQMRPTHFLMISLFLDHDPIGVIYADRGQSNRIEEQHHQYFKRICRCLETALQALNDRNHAKQQLS